jgi:HlyD family secretion protein
VEPSGFTKISALGVEEQRVNVVIDFARPDEAFARLGDRYRVEVRVVVWEERDVVKVPVSSLARDGERWSVFVVDADHARRVAIEVGPRNDMEAQVLKGLTPGQTVIAYPSDDIADGVAVTTDTREP